MKWSLIPCLVVFLLVACQAAQPGGMADLSQGSDVGAPASFQKTDPDLGATQDTPQTITTTPFLGTSQPHCEKTEPFCIFINRRKCSGESLRIEVNVGINKPELSLEDIEVSLQFPGGAQTGGLSPFSEGSGGTYSTLITPIIPSGVEEYTVKILVNNIKENPKSLVYTGHLLVPYPTPPNSGYGTDCTTPQVPNDIRPTLDSGTSTGY